MTLRRYTTRFLLLSLSLVLLSACTLATVRTLEEDEEAKQGFNATDYVNDIWDDRFLPTYEENAVDMRELLTLLDEDEDAAIEQYGSRTGTSGFSFMIRSEAEVLEVNTESRIGLMTLDIPPYDGESDASMYVGPVIRGRNNSALDAVGFIQFNDFTNQTEFASVSDAIKQRVLDDVISQIDVDTIAGQNISFIGSFSQDPTGRIEIVPITLEVGE